MSKSLAHGGLGHTDTMDWQILRASRTPGPGQYYHDDTLDSIPGGRLGTAKSKTAVDWECYRASQIPGPGDYYVDDLLDSISGGRMAKGKAKSSIEWECYRASQIPAPGDYYVDDTSASIPGGRMAKGKAKTFVEWEQHRASQIPGPDYDTESSWKALEGKGGSRKNGTSMGSRTGPGVMPFPYQNDSVPGACPVRREPSASHEMAQCPWREPDWQQRKAEAGAALNRSLTARPSSAAPQQSQTERSPMVASTGPRENSYSRSLTPWRDKPDSKATPTALYGKEKAADEEEREATLAGKLQRPTSAPPARQPAVPWRSGVVPPKKTMAEQAAEDAELMPWRDKEKWASANQEVKAMRQRAGGGRVEDVMVRGPFGGPQATIEASSKRTVVKKTNPAGPRASALLARASASGGQQRPQKGERRRGAGHRANKGRKAGSSRSSLELRARFEPSRNASTSGLLRLAADPESIGGTAGGSYHLGEHGEHGHGEAWRLNLRDRAERLAAFSFGDGQPVETGVILVDAPNLKPKPKRKGGKAGMRRKSSTAPQPMGGPPPRDYMPSAL